MTEKELKDVRMIFKTQMEHGCRSITLNTLHFKELLDMAGRTQKQEAEHERLEMIVGMMKDLLEEMKTSGDLDGYDTKDIFEQLEQLEENKRSGQNERNNFI